MRGTQRWRPSLGPRAAVAPDPARLSRKGTTVKIPPEARPDPQGVHPNHVSAHALDSSASEQGREQVNWRQLRARVVIIMTAVVIALGSPSHASAVSPAPGPSQAWVPAMLLLSIALLIGVIAALVNAWAARADGRSWPCTLTRAGAALVAGTGVMLAIFTFLGLAL